MGDTHSLCLLIKLPGTILCGVVVVIVGLDLAGTINTVISD